MDHVTEPASTGPASPYRFVIEASIFLMQFAMGLSFMAVAPLFPPIMEAYHVDNATVSLLVGVTSLSVALALVPASVLAARLGAKASLIVGGVLMGATALSPFTGSFALLLATRASFALGAAINLSATPAVILRWFSPKEMAVVNGANVIAQSLGVTMSMILGPRLVAPLGWSGALAVFGVVALAATALWVVLGRAGEGGVADAGFSTADLRAVMGNRTVLLLAGGLAGALGAFISIQSWLPTFYNAQRGYSLEEAGAIGGLLSFFGIVGALLGSTLPVRIPQRRPFLVAGGVGIPLAAAGAILLDQPALYGALLMLGIVGWIFMPVVFTIPMEIPGMTGARVGIAVALVLGAGNLAGFFIPLMVGYLRDLSGSFTLGLALACALAPLMALGALAMPETGPVGDRTPRRVEAEVTAP